MTSATPSSDPELSSIESKLFEFMRDGVITGLRSLSDKPNRRWVCDVAVPFPTQASQLLGTSFEDVTALGAYMKAFTHIMTLKLTDRPIYSKQVLAKRRQLGLE